MDIRNKILNDTSLKIRLSSWSNDVVVFTNGCFDILHPGHVFFLQAAASFGGKLLVGLNTDRSIKKLKGKDRPINNMEHRALMLAALGFVDAIIPFDEDHPMNLIKTIVNEREDKNPSLILVKGGDYKESDIVGAKFVKQHNGLVRIVPTVDEYSTTGIIKKISDKCK